MPYDASQPLDSQGRAIYAPLPFVTSKTIIFTGGTPDTIGDYDGDLNPFTIFEVTGDVMCFVIGVCKTTLVGAATLEVGVTDATAAIIAQIGNATDLVANEVWHEATPSLAEAMSPRYHFIGGGLDVIGTAGSANITAGKIDFYCFWRPLSTDGKVSA
jgi:hypothetical protein